MFSNNVQQCVQCVQCVLPGPERGGGDGDVLGLPDGAGHVVGQVVASLHGLRELDHHHAGERVPVLHSAQ